MWRGGLLLLRHATPLTRRNVVYFCAAAYTPPNSRLKNRICDLLMRSSACTDSASIIPTQTRPLNVLEKHVYLAKRLSRSSESKSRHCDWNPTNSAGESVAVAIGVFEDQQECLE